MGNWLNFIGAIFKLAATISDTKKGGSSYHGENTDIHTDNKNTTIFVDRRKDGSIRVSKAPFKKK